jgi:hypothetical protein
VALENAVEGCVRETYGAALACACAARAADARVRDVMRSIARDECKHAELSWKLAAWATPQLAVHERKAVRATMRAAGRALLTGGDDAMGEAASHACGMPTRDERRCIAALLEQGLVRMAA